MKNQHTVTIVITTKDRKSDLSKCLDSCLTLKGVSEILVFDDGSSDNTYSFVKENFPNVSLYRSEKSLGLINARTKCATLAKGEIIVSIDDDCIFQDDSTIEEIISYFSAPNIAVVTIPYINVLYSNEILQRGIGLEDQIYICSHFAGGAHAIVKNVFLELGGYYESLGRQSEETDLAMRIYNQGYSIRIANCSKPILHFHSTIRNLSQIAFYQARNLLIVDFRNTPLVFLPFVLVRMSVLTLIFAYQEKQLKFGLLGCIDALKNILTIKVKRTPMTLSNFLFFKRLRRNYYYEKTKIEVV